MDASLSESLLGYHPVSAGFLKPVAMNWQWDKRVRREFDWAVASERYREALKSSSEWLETILKSAKAEGSLTAIPTGGAGMKVGLSDPVVSRMGFAIAQRIKAPPGDNRLITPKSSH